jgi:hypothetical protein
VNQLLEAIGRVLASWKPWVVVAPWEIGVRVRLGRVAASLLPGPHLRIPVLDRVVLVNTRLRIGQTPTLTLECEDQRHVRVLSAIVGYAILDPVLAILAYNYPGQSINGLAMAAMARNLDAAGCLEEMRREVGPHGIEVRFVEFVERVEVRALRLLNSQWSTEVSRGDSSDGLPPVSSY